MVAKGKIRHRAAKVFHDHAQEYDSWFAGSLVYAIELAALLSLQTAFAHPRLEIGVGPGRFARALGAGLGLDPARAPLLLARQRGISCIQGVGEHLPVKARRIGTAYLLFTLCFSESPRQILSECARILKPGGYLVIGLIPRESNWGRYLGEKKAAGHIFYEHANFYTIRTVGRWLAEAGMRIIEHRSTLYQSPEHVEHQEDPCDVLDEQAGFAVIVATKDHD